MGSGRPRPVRNVSTVPKVTHMAPSPRSKPTRRPPAKAAAKTAAKARPAGQTGKGLVKLVRAQDGTAKGKTVPVRAKAETAKTKKNQAARPAAAARAPARKLASTETKKPAARRTPRVREAAPAIDLAARDREVARDAAVTAVNGSLDLLETLALTGPVPLAVLAETAGCAAGTASELLSLLRARNFVIQDEELGLWRLGTRWAVMRREASEQGALAATAMPFLSGLGNATGENVYLRVREGMECVTVAIYQADPGLRIYTDVGAKMPLHAGSGRLLLAHAPETVQTQVLAQRLQRYTPSTRIDPTWIAADLHRIRQRGFLITDSEVVAGTVTVCAPVRDASGQVIAGLLIAAPSLRMRPPRPRGLMPSVVDAAKKLSQALGFAIEPPAEPRPDADTPPEPRRQPESAWPAGAIGANIARPHSIFRQA